MTQACPLDSGTHSDLVRVILQLNGSGVIESSELAGPVVVVHVGSPVRVECRYGPKSHVGLTIHGDVDVVPAGVPARREMRETDTALLIAIAPTLLNRVAEELGHEMNAVQLQSRFQIRDPQIEHIGWALKAEIEQGYPGGSLYMDSMATALAVQLLRRHSSLPSQRPLADGGLPPRKLRQVLSYIEDNLRRALPLQAVADAAGVSVSHLKVLFRRSLGLPVHQYVVRRRVDRAALLIREGKLTISQIAMETGFAHQSHLAMQMRRILGVSPSHLRRLFT
jgi:AraC family transcriptional regulator